MQANCDTSIVAWVIIISIYYTSRLRVSYPFDGLLYLFPLHIKLCDENWNLFLTIRNSLKDQIAEYYFYKRFFPLSFA